MFVSRSVLHKVMVVAVILIGFVSGVFQPTWAEPPGGWNVKLSVVRLVPKQDLYMVTAEVKDQTGNPVDSAQVGLHIKCWNGEHVIPLTPIGHGRYRGGSTLHDAGAPCRVLFAVVQPNEAPQ